MSGGHNSSRSWLSRKNNSSNNKQYSPQQQQQRPRQPPLHPSRQRHPSLPLYPPSALCPTPPPSPSAALVAAQLAQSLSATTTSTTPTSLPQPSTPFDPNLTTIYVGNLSPPVTEEILTAYFSQVGPLAAVRLQADGSSPNRFAFVEFVAVDKANAALALHGQLLLGRPMKVGKASTPITNRALLGGVAVGGGVVLGEAERVARLQLAGGNVSSDKMAAALARVAQAQQLIANKFGVPVQAPATALLPVLTAALPPATAVPEGLATPDTGAGKEGGVERKRSVSRSRSRSSERNRRRRRSMSVSRSRSPSPSLSRSRSPSHSRSRSRSPQHRQQRRVRRWSRERDRGGRGGGDRRRGRDGSEERRDRRHGRRRSYSRSPSPRPERRASAEHEKKDDMDVSSDRWRGTAADTANDEQKKNGHTADERKESVAKDDDRGRGRHTERDANSHRDRHRDDRRRDRSRDRSRSRERHRGRDSRHRSSRHGRRRYSDESGDEEFVHRRARENVGQRNRYKKNTAGREGLQWDGYQWVPAAPKPQSTTTATASPGVSK